MVQSHDPLSSIFQDFSGANRYRRGDDRSFGGLNLKITTRNVHHQRSTLTA
jgi:hypothetical protein